MTSNGWLQIALFGVIVIVITRPFRRLHDARVRRRADASAPAAAPGRAQSPDLYTGFMRCRCSQYGKFTGAGPTKTSDPEEGALQETAAPLR
jgi:hypothetical protein